MREAGLVDMVGSEDEDSWTDQDSCINSFRLITRDDMSYDECEDDLNRVCADLAGWTGDTAKALAEISDNYFFMEVKKEYDPSMVTGFIRLNGTTVGCVANQYRNL